MQSDSCTEIRLCHVVVNLIETLEYLFYFVFVNTDSVIGDIYLEIIFQSTPVGIVVTGFL